jgi:hypothetical protein
LSLVVVAIGVGSLRTFIRGLQLFVADPKGWFVMESGGGMTSVSTINILERDLSVKSSELGKSAQSIQNQKRIAFFLEGN